MHQIIFTPEISPNYFGSNVIDIDDKNMETLSWNNIFTYINVKYRIPIDKIKIKTDKGYINHSNINPFGKFPYEKYCYYSSKGKPTKSYLVKFDIKLI